MAIGPPKTLADFGTRSIVTHAIMILGFIGAVASALFVEGDVGMVSFVAFVNFTSGMWICQSIHSLGNTAAGVEYDGVLNEVLQYVR
ncbi:hypothetical protein ACFQJ7_09065 [Halovenus rubra]|uniref:Uncharacterized protein n=2 Tax=Halovenus rubra TaxID=869890 RepID=A0ABD5XB77_9EURY|nr:hypothetical protein [Halovenus rubra]